MKPKKKIKIGVIGEDFNNDAVAFCTLLSKRPYENTHFKAFNIKGVTANNIESALAVARHIKAEIAQNELEYVICVKDLDGTLNDKQSLAIKDTWLSTFKKAVGKEAQPYLVIAEMEALLLADVAVINEKYGTNFSKHRDPMLIQDPKKELMTETAKKSKQPYKENHCNDIMKDIDFDTIYKNHKGDRSFKTFIDELDIILKHKKN